MKKTFLLLCLLIIFICVNIFPQDVPSLGPAPYVLNKAPQSVVFDAAVGTRAFTQISTTPTFQFGKSFMQSCIITNIGTAFPIGFPGGLMYRNGIVYTWNQISPFQLYSIDTVTGVHTFIVNMAGVPQANLTGMTWDGTNVYAVSSSIAVSQILTVNITTGVCTPIGTPSAVCAGAIAILGRIGIQYSLFSWDIVLDNLYKWNKTTGIATLVGPLGANTNFGQDGSVDANDNTFYAVDYSTGPELRRIDTTTGAFGPVLCTYTAQATGLACVPFVPPPSFTLCQGFNTTTFPPNGWTLTGTDTIWNYDAVSGFGNGTGSAKADFYNVSTGTQQLNYTLGGFTTPGDSLIFQDAYCTFTTENDQLQILTSTNSGTTWVSLVTLNGGVSGPLVTAPPQTTSFVPTAAQWKYQRFALPFGTNKIQFNAITAFGNNLYIDSICVRVLEGIISNNGIAKDFLLSQNYPNPFNPTTVIKFTLPESQNVKLVVFDILGREVKTLVNEVRSSGIYEVNFDASELSSGLYFYRFVTDNFTDTKKMLLIK